MATETIAGLVSTIIPVFNRPAMLREAVESVLAQSYRPIEIIISDDGSQDGTGEVARALAAAYPGVICALFNPNRGAGPAREAGRQAARGEFIQYLDSDDLLWPGKFTTQVKALADHPDSGAAYGWIRLCVPGLPPGTRPFKWSGRKLDSLFPGLLVDRWWNTNAPLWRRTVCDRIGPWSDLTYSEDWEYDARAGALGIRLVYCPEFVCDQRQHAGNQQTSHGVWLTPPEQVRFFTSMHESALQAGVRQDTPEMRHFTRWVFARARYSGAAGDAGSAQSLYRLARACATTPDLKMKLVGVAARLLGWKVVGGFSQFRDRFTGTRTGRHTQELSWPESGDGPA